MFDFPLCLAKVLRCFSNFDALLTLFQANTATRLFYGVRNFAKPYIYMISYQSLLYSTTVLYDDDLVLYGKITCFGIIQIASNMNQILINTEILKCLQT